MPTYPAKQHISITIDQPFDEVYAFLSEPADFATWASGLGSAFRMIGPFVWTAETVNGPVTVSFSAPMLLALDQDQSERTDAGELNLDSLRSYD